MKNLIFAFTLLLPPLTVQAQQFKVSFAKELSSQSFPGNMYIFLSKNDSEPIKAPHWIMMNPVAVARVAKTNDLFGWANGRHATVWGKTPWQFGASGN